MSAEHHDVPEESIRLAAGRIGEAIDALAEGMLEGVQIEGMAALIRAVERCAAALEALAESSAASVALIEAGRKEGAP